MNVYCKTEVKVSTGWSNYTGILYLLTKHLLQLNVNYLKNLLTWANFNSHLFKKCKYFVVVKKKLSLQFGRDVLWSPGRRPRATLDVMSMTRMTWPIGSAVRKHLKAVNYKYSPTMKLLSLFCYPRKNMTKVLIISNCSPPVHN